jgi:hypothetical protein
LHELVAIVTNLVDEPARPCADIVRVNPLEVAGRPCDRSTELSDQAELVERQRANDNEIEKKFLALQKGLQPY